MSDAAATPAAPAAAPSATPAASAPAPTPFNAGQWFDSWNPGNFPDPEAPKLPEFKEGVDQGKLLQQYLEQERAHRAESARVAQNRTTHAELRKVLTEGIPFGDSDDLRIAVDNPEIAAQIQKFITGTQRIGPVEIARLATLDLALKRAREVGARGVQTPQTPTAQQAPKPGAPSAPVVIPKVEGRKPASAGSADIGDILANRFGLTPQVLANDPDAMFRPPPTK